MAYLDSYAADMAAMHIKVVVCNKLQDPAGANDAQVRAESVGQSSGCNGTLFTFRASRYCRNQCANRAMCVGVMTS